MQITILAIGSRGDVQPYIALGLGLQREGHKVQIATHNSFEPLIRSYRLDFFSLGEDPQQALETEAGRSWVESGNNQLQFVLSFLRVARPRIEQILNVSWNACQGSELILYSRLGFFGYHIAEKLGVPSFMAFLQPNSRTRYFPCEAFKEPPDWLPFRQRWNWFTHVIVEQVLWQPFRNSINSWRNDVLGLPPIPFWGPYKVMAQAHYPALYGYSPLLIPKPTDWADWLHVTGYWFLDHLSTWQPPDQLVDFIDSGPPPISIGFGSMTDREPQDFLNILLEALSRTRQRAILLAGWTGLRASDMPDHVYVTEEVPHDWLFPKVSAVVHHGGAGTTAAGLRAGVPNILIPFFGDQLFWASLVARLYVGPKPIPRKQLSVENLSAAIRLATQDKVMRSRAASMGARIRHEDGVGQAIFAIHQDLERISRKN